MHKDAKSQPLALTDWSANVEAISTDCETLLWELALHLLLRDEVLIQDEALAQSARLAEWFITDDNENHNLRILEELIDVGVLTVIVLDPIQYPEDLRELARHSPIAARAAQIQREGRKHGEPFELTPQQRKFHRRLDLFLTEKHAIRPRHMGSNEKSVHRYFGEYLLRVLRNDVCDTWAQSWFSMDKRSREEIATFVENPLAAVERVRKEKPEAVTPKMLEDPRFTRNLGHLLADTYRSEPDKKKVINNLAHSAYAAAFCKIEGNTCGRYTNDLHEILLGSTALSRERPPAVRLDPCFVVPVGLPALKPGIAGILNTVRETGAGKHLREGFHGREMKFEKEREDWTVVSEEMARHVARVGRTVTVSGWIREIVDHAKERVPVYFVQSVADGCDLAIKLPPPQVPADYLRYLAPLGIRALEVLGEGAWLTFNRNYLQVGRVEEDVRDKLTSISPFGVSDIEPTWRDDQPSPLPRD